jgi:RNA polymerase subunit RPABC4/transcription elongation factor Spt4
VAADRQCPHCGSSQITHVQRGLAGDTDERDQFLSCHACQRLTYEIISRTPREIRIGRLEAGRQVRLGGFEYVVSRVLKVGLNESLVYVKPAPDQDSALTRLRPGHR